MSRIEGRERLDSDLLQELLIAVEKSIAESAGSSDCDDGLGFRTAAIRAVGSALQVLLRHQTGIEQSHLTEMQSYLQRLEYLER